MVWMDSIDALNPVVRRSSVVLLGIYPPSSCGITDANYGHNTVIAVVEAMAGSRTINKGIRMIACQGCC